MYKHSKVQFEKIKRYSYENIPQLNLQTQMHCTATYCSYGSKYEEADNK